MAYSVHFRVDLDSVPGVARDEIQRTMTDIAEALSTVPPSSPFWISMKDSLLQIDVMHFRVVYRADPRRRDIEVLELAPVGG